MKEMVPGLFVNLLFGRTTKSTSNEGKGARRGVVRLGEETRLSLWQGLGSIRLGMVG